MGWDPCREIPYVVNPRGAPPMWEANLREAIRLTTAASGLRFRYDGMTDFRDFSPTPGTPVLVAWARRSELPGIGARGGVGRPIMAVANGRHEYVGGVIVLDSEMTTRWASQSQPDALHVALLLQQLGHLLGLADVDRDDQLMSRSGLHLLRFGPGDQQGLARLGDLPCLG